jgi:hypothetical protein
MTPAEKERLTDALRVTSEVCGSELSDAAVRVYILELQRYDIESVLGALRGCYRELSGKLSLSAVFQRLPQESKTLKLYPKVKPEPKKLPMTPEEQAEHDRVKAEALAKIKQLGENDVL